MKFIKKIFLSIINKIDGHRINIRAQFCFCMPAMNNSKINFTKKCNNSPNQIFSSKFRVGCTNFHTENFKTSVRELKEIIRNCRTYNIHGLKFNIEKGQVLQIFLHIPGEFNTQRTVWHPQMNKHTSVPEGHPRDRPRTHGHMTNSTDDTEKESFDEGCWFNGKHETWHLLHPNIKTFTNRWPI